MTKSKTKEPLSTTEDYNLIVTDNPVSNPDLASAYQIVNKVTGVVEMETSRLAEAYAYLEGMQKDLLSYRDNIEIMPESTETLAGRPEILLN